MSQLLFLGTGPIGGIVAQDKSKRLESSALLETPKANLLIDVSRNFDLQSKSFDQLDAILVTHGHRDASGGIPQLLDWLTEHKQDQVPLYTLSKTIEIIKRHYQPAYQLDFHPVRPFKSFSLFGLKITPLPVEHSLQPGFPTLGYFVKFESSTTSFAYISDVVSWQKQTEGFMKKADTLIIDGSMWKQQIASHLTIDEMLPLFCSWANNRIILTHVGKTAPPYEILVREVKKICPKALVAYDGLRLTL